MNNNFKTKSKVIKPYDYSEAMQTVYNLALEAYHYCDSLGLGVHQKVRSLQVALQGIKISIPYMGYDFADAQDDFITAFMEAVHPKEDVFLFDSISRMTQTYIDLLDQTAANYGYNHILETWNYASLGDTICIPVTDPQLKFDLVKLFAETTTLVMESEHPMYFHTNGADISLSPQQSLNILPNGYGVLGYPYLSEIQIEGSPDISKYSPDDKYGFRFFYKYGDKFWDILKGVMHDTVIVLQGDPEELLVISDKLFYEVVGN